MRGFGMSNTGKRKILIPIQPPPPIKTPEPPYNALRAAIDRALSSPSNRSAKHWGFITDDNLGFSLYYEYDEANKPLDVCPIPINHEVSVYSNEIKQAIKNFYGDTFSPIEYMKRDYENFKTFTDYVCNTDHYIEMKLTLKNLTTGKNWPTSDINTEGCYFFRENDKLYDLWFDEYERVEKDTKVPFIEGFNGLNYRPKQEIQQEVKNKINEMINTRIEDLKVKDCPIYGQEWKFETAHKVKIDDKISVIDIVVEVKL